MKLLLQMISCHENLQCVEPEVRLLEVSPMLKMICGWTRSFLILLLLFSTMPRT